MKIKIPALLFLLSLSVVAPHEANAQFWKKIFGKKKERKVYKVPDYDMPPKKDGSEKVDNTKLKDFSYPETQLKSRYRIDIVAPFYLNELVDAGGNTTFKYRAPNKVVPILEFYEGLKLALDTLKTFGYQFDVYVHDIKNPSTPVSRVATKSVMGGSDLIIGLVQSDEIPPIANFAKKEGVNFVSALSPSDADIDDNPYFLLMQPTLQSHCEWILSKIKKKYSQDPIVFYRTSIPMDENAYGYIEDYVSDNSKVLCNNFPTQEELYPMFSKTGTNVILMSLLDDRYAESIIKKLYEWFPDYQFDVWGMPSWNMPSLKRPDKFPNVAVYITVPFYFDATTRMGKIVTDRYKTEYGGNKPKEMVYRGYETMYWYAYLLKKYGNIFNSSIHDNGGSPFTRFEMKPQLGDKKQLLYFENKNLYLYRYQSGSYMVQSY